MVSPLISSTRRASPLWNSCASSLKRALHAAHSVSGVRAVAGPFFTRARLIRSLHSSYPRMDKRSLEEEKKALEKLTREFQNGSYKEQEKLFRQLREQEERFLRICLQYGKDEITLAPIPTGEALTLASVDRSVSLTRYIRNRYSQGIYWKDVIANDAAVEEVATDFSADNTMFNAATGPEVNAYLIAFFRLQNGLNSLQDIEFLDETVQRLFQTYVEKGQSLEDFSLFGLNPVVVSRWIEVFDAFKQVPESAFERDVSNFRQIFAKLSESMGRNPFELQSGNTNDAKNNDAKNEKKIENYVSFVITPKMVRFFMLGLLGATLVVILFSDAAEASREITFQEFSATFLRRNLVKKVRVINNRTVVVELNEKGRAQYPGHSEYLFAIGSVETFERNLKAAQDEYHIPDPLRVPVVFLSEGSVTKFLVNFLPTLLFLGAMYYMSKKASMGGMGGPMSFGKSTAKKFNQETNVKTKFKDVAGMDEAKIEVMEFVKFLQDPGRYEKLGAKIPRGAILSGPPGTGKTLIARATAGEADVPFYSVSGSEFVEMFVGVGASRVRDLFKTARENAPSIVFVDEIDAIGKQRAKGKASGANDERETTLNQLLVEMDGFDTSDHVVVLAGTNRPDILDRALLRPGRFDRHIYIDNPELEGRKDIFKVHLKKIKLADNIDSDLPGRLATLTPGFSGADIANVCNEAALIAARYNAKAVTLRHFELAIERVIGGVEKKSKLLSPEEKKVVAYHEAGHAVCGWFLEHAVPLLKVSIIPRGMGVLGYAQYLPADQYLQSALELQDRMVMTLGGRVSEELNFKQVTGGAHDDFKKVTNIAQSMVLRFGMSPEVGFVNYADSQSQDNLAKPFSDKTNRIIDSEVKRIVQECHDRCTRLLFEKRDAVELVAMELLKKEFITREDMIRLLGKRPFPERNDAFDKYLAGKDAFKNEQPDEEKKDTE